MAPNFAGPALVMSTMDGLVLRIVGNEMHQEIAPDIMVNHQLAVLLNKSYTELFYGDWHGTLGSVGTVGYDFS